MTRHHRDLNRRFENTFPLAEWANQDPFWRWPAILVAILLLYGVAGYFDLQDLTHAAAPLILGTGATVIPFSNDAAAADRLDRAGLAHAHAQALAATPTETQRRALIAARLDGEEIGFDRGFLKGARAGLWLGALSGAAAGAVLAQLFRVLHEWGGIVSFLAGFFQ